MEHLDDELDLRYHKGLDPDVYYRCPTLESLEGALRNEVDKSSSSFIPTHVVTEFIFALASTITIPVTEQSNLDALIEPADHLQSIAVEYVLCRDIHGKERLRVQRAIARSIITAIQETDGFEYSERSVYSKAGGDGARLRYVCRDSLQNRYRKSNTKKDASHDSDGSDLEAGKQAPGMLPTYDCGGAIHVKFSLKRQAINVVYKHNPIHTARPASDSPPLPAIGEDHDVAPPAPAAPAPTPAPEKQPPRKRKGSKRAEVDVDNENRNANLDMSDFPESQKPSAKKRKKEGVTQLPKPVQTVSPKQSKKAKSLAATAKTQKKASAGGSSILPLPANDKACIRCREKKIKCDRLAPTCNQCQRGLWTCQYEVPNKKKRSRSGCLNCKARKRKCTEEQPSCAHCLRLDDDCEYATYP